jgi:hypothetical protein
MREPLDAERDADAFSGAAVAAGSSVREPSVMVMAGNNSGCSAKLQRARRDFTEETTLSEHKAAHSGQATALDRRPGPVGDPGGGEANDQARPLIAATSAGVNFREAAAMFSSRWPTEPVPGIGRIDGERASSQASTT